MKNIIVRVWDVNNKRFVSRDENDGQWETIFIVAGWEIRPASVRQYGLSGEPELCEWGGSYKTSISTEIKDKNGREIYEGDIVKYNDAGGETHTRVIKYDDEMGAFCCDRGAYVDYFTCMWEIEVVGNIYENPGLLKDNL
jgi:hypothetical protein F3_00892